MGDVTRWPWEPPLPAVSVEQTVTALQRDFAYAITYTAIIVHSTHPELRIIVNTTRGQIIPRGECRFTDGSSFELQDLGMPQVGVQTLTVQELTALIWQIAQNLGLDIA